MTPEQILEITRAAIEMDRECRMTFEEWWNRQMVDEWWEKQTMWPSEYNTAKAAWQAAQEAEMKRIMKIVEQVGIQGNHNQWFDCCDTIVERIGK